MTINRPCTVPWRLSRYTNDLSFDSHLLQERATEVCTQTQTRSHIDLLDSVFLWESKIRYIFGIDCGYWTHVRSFAGTRPHIYTYTYTHAYIHIYTHTHTGGVDQRFQTLAGAIKHRGCVYRVPSTFLILSQICRSGWHCGVATISRLLQIIGLFWKRAL